VLLRLELLVFDPLDSELSLLFCVRLPLEVALRTLDPLDIELNLLLCELEFRLDIPDPLEFWLYLLLIWERPPLDADRLMVDALLLRLCALQSKLLDISLWERVMPEFTLVMVDPVKSKLEITFLRVGGTSMHSRFTKAILQSRFNLFMTASMSLSGTKNLSIFPSIIELFGPS